MAEALVDRAGLAALRPGVPMADVAKAYGTAWKPPLPHREGRVLTIDMSDGVVTRFTREGRLGSIRFNWRFGDAIPVLGLHMGARWDVIALRFPHIDPAPLAAKPFAWIEHHLGPRLHMRMEIGTTYDQKRYLCWIELSDPGAVYPEKQPVVYPAPSGVPGAPFKDVNFKLAVLSELIDSGAIDIGDPQDLYDHVLGRHFDLEQEGYDEVPEARAYLARYPLTPDLLARVRAIEFDGGATIYSYIHFFWSGEDDAFTIRLFAGIEALPNLKSVRIISMVDEAVDRTLLRRRGITVK
ncbi:MAG: DUF6892 domain-containing protein [Hyphomicrobiaceae bacterium]